MSDILAKDVLAVIGLGTCTKYAARGVYNEYKDWKARREKEIALKRAYESLHQDTVENEASFETPKARNK